MDKATIFDVYQFGPLLGSGTFGQVLACWHVDQSVDDGLYAVKAVDASSDVFRHASRYLSPRQEADILQVVLHPHIIELIDVFEEGTWVFTVIARISGGELFASLANPVLEVTESIVSGVGSQLLQALHHLHSKSVVHRDVKAENVLLSQDPSKSGYWHSKLIDFGLATTFDRNSFVLEQEQERHEQFICGTLYYCAPEVWGSGYSPRVDVWAVGVLLYLVVHGRFPFYDRDPAALEARICDEAQLPSFEPVCATECPGFRASAEATACLRALLSKDPDRRPNASVAIAEQTWLRLGTSQSLFAGFQAPLPKHVKATPDQAIPMPIRIRGARAAASPPVDAALERSRTAALEAFKVRSLPDKRPGHSGARDLPPLRESASWGSSDEETPTGRCLPLKSRGRNVAESFLTDSDVEDERAGMCVCGG